MKRVNFTLCLAQVKQKRGQNVMKFMLLHKSERNIYCTHVCNNVRAQKSMFFTFVGQQQSEAQFVPKNALCRHYRQKKR